MLTWNAGCCTRIQLSGGSVSRQTGGEQETHGYAQDIYVAGLYSAEIPGTY